ncbi:hypothetical protein BRADI_5g12992v3 [Brachypodium distachyon]|uniref:Uncharacterized protein n=1 Tax=Brachypodium distachyon TaxID=15368 RepID=A0A2K2CGW3_BRADI|nr:hypothetical protein BRADI_5g12992v3 [Brachypodium distachyon]
MCTLQLCNKRFSRSLPETIRRSVLRVSREELNVMAVSPFSLYVWKSKDNKFLFLGCILLYQVTFQSIEQ